MTDQEREALKAKIRDKKYGLGGATQMQESLPQTQPSLSDAQREELKSKIRNAKIAQSQENPIIGGLKDFGNSLYSDIDEFKNQMSDAYKKEGVTGALGKYAEYAGTGLKQLLSPAEPILKPIAEAEEKYWGNPLRGAISAGQRGENPIPYLTADVNKLEPQPEWQSIAETAGVPKEVQLGKGKIPAAKLAGGFMGAATSPLNAIPIERVLNSATEAYQAAKPTLNKIGNAAAKAETKIASATTGTPEQVVKTYANDTDAVNSLIDKYGNDIQSMTDDAKRSIMSKVQGKKSELNTQIKKTLENAGPNPDMDVSSVVSSLEEAKRGLNPATKAAEISEIDEMLSTINKLHQNGATNAQNLFDMKEYLQGRAKGAYLKNGQVFNPGKESQLAAKYAAREARKHLNMALPDIADANNKLSLLHGIEETMPANILKEGMGDSSYLAIGKTPHGRARKQLTKLEKLVGADLVKDADRVAAASEFASPQLMPKSGGSTSTTRTIVGGGTGYVLGGPAGAAAGLAATSPMSLKLGLNLANKGKKVASEIGNINRLGVDGLSEFLKAAPVDINLGQVLEMSRARSKDSNK